MKKHDWSTYKIVQETKDTVSIYFDTNQEAFSFLPGQFINISCQIDGKQIIRSYSLSSTPTDQFPCITVKRVHGGIMSNYLVDEAKSITAWTIQGPFGNFILESHLSQDYPLIFLGGGSGISPLFSMLNSLNTPTNKPLLIYSNRSTDETIFGERLLQMEKQGLVNASYSFTAQNQNPQADQDRGIVQSKYTLGRFSIEKIQAILKEQTYVYTLAHYYICGPIGLMNLYEEALKSLHIPKEQIHMEYFDLEEDQNTVITNTSESRDIFVHYFEDTLVNDDLQTYQCTVLLEVKANQSLLEAIKAYNIRVPSSCKNGTCGSCWAIKTEGEVKMRNNRVLTESNIAEGVILLCQSYPLDDDVTISLLE
ncbi:flavin reductase family protein [Myroides odoratus]|uniref:flavin reductase family protein n=1 Tax=Myroides odoratus TaxID=256 RepID=UPI0039B0CC58